jgi:hypothetical protein
MSKTKSYNILITSKTQTDPIKALVKDVSDFRSILLLVNMPFRTYHTMLNIARTLGLQHAAAAQVESGAMMEEAAATDVATEATAGLNTQLMITIGLLTLGVGLIAAFAGYAYGKSQIASAGAAGVPSLQAPEGGASHITSTGLAMVHAGETVGRGVGGMGDVNISIANLTLSPEGESLTDFTSRMGEQLRTIFRSFTRDLPV